MRIVAFLSSIVGVAAVAVGVAFAAHAGGDGEPAVVRLENDSVRVLEIRIPPGGKVGVHSHPARVVVVLEDYKMRFFSPDGSSRVKERKKGDIIYHEATTHSAENINDKEFHTLVIELKPNAQTPAVSDGTQTFFVPPRANNHGGGVLLDAFAGPFAKALGRADERRPLTDFEKVKSAASDGHTLLVARDDLHFARYTVGGPAYTDFEPVCLLATTPYVLAVEESAPWRDVAALVADARKRPGSITYARGSEAAATAVATAGATAGATASSALVPALFARAANIKLKASDDAAAKVDVRVVAPGELQANGLRPLAVASAQRARSLPGVSTLRELGFDVVHESHMGILAPKGTTPAILDALDGACSRATADRDLRDHADEVGATVSYLPRTSFATFLRDVDARIATHARAVAQPPPTRR